jgi:HK97 family phage portal protein
MSGILSPEIGTTINSASAEQLKAKFKKSTDIYEGHSNGIVVLDSGFKYTPISVSARDSQLIESKSLNEVDICKFFGVPPSLAFSNGSAKFGTAEQEQISFLNNSLTALLEKIESEMFRKIYLPSEYNTHELKFDVDNLFRSDATTKAAYFTQLYNLGALSTNEIREKINSKYPVKGGNQHFIQVNLQPIDNLYVNKGETPHNVDNNLK